jgi:hypothetical protein
MNTKNDQSKTSRKNPEKSALIETYSPFEMFIA